MRQLMGTMSSGVRPSPETIAGAEVGGAGVAVKTCSPDPDLVQVEPGGHTTADAFAVLIGSVNAMPQQDVVDVGSGSL